MEKRLFLAIVLSVAILWLWGAVAPRFFPELAQQKREKPVAGPAARPVAPGATASKTTTTQPVLAVQTPAQPAVIVSARTLVETVVETAEFTARFSNRGGVLTSFQLKKYTDSKKRPVDLVKARDSGAIDYPFAIESTDRPWNVVVNRALYQVDDQVRGDSRQITYRFSDAAGRSVTKQFTVGSELRFGFSVVTSPSHPPFRLLVGPGIRTIAADESDNQFVITGNGVIQRAGSLEVISREEAARYEVYETGTQFAGIEDNYFLTAIQPQRAGEVIFRAVDLPTGKPGKVRKDLFVGINADKGEVSGFAYFGPKQAELLERYGLEATLQFGMFGIVSRFLLRALTMIYEYTHNYGWAIIVLTVIIKILLFPLQHKSIVSMKKMQKLQPKMKQIQEKYKKSKSDPDQRQRMNTEMMKLYQEEKISPASGCLPILLQLPILWGFYSLLSQAIELRGADFMLWIHDLSIKDPYYVTPILMTATMFIQQWMTPAGIDPVQRKMFLAMPIIFGWIFKEFPSGLVLYWLVQNVLTIIQQMIMNRYWKDHPDE